MSDKSSPQLVIVSNRLPFTVTFQKGEWRFRRSSGGLVTALSALQASRPFQWVGWPGREATEKEQQTLRQTFQNEYACQPVFLPRQEMNHYYNGFCNRVLWPLFHYLPNEMSFQDSYWQAYQKVNERFADAILERVKPGDDIWIHDFHLMLLPAILKKRMPSLNIGFFLHIPFPSSEVYRLLAVRHEVLRGLLGADLIGFHSYDYLRHFSSSCLRLLGLEVEPTGIHYQSRRVQLGVFPIGIDPESFQTTLKSSKCQGDRKRLRKAFADRKIILGIDRMDYTKGLPLKLKAFEKFLEKNPEQRDKVLLYQVAVPSRMDIEAYQKLTVEVDELVGRINGLYGSVERSPIYYLNKGVSFENLCALYATADMALLTPVRDGMNLVAQEYVLCSRENKGVLILSEFAGAAHSLSGCLRINPWDLDQVVQAIEQALAMSEGEKEERYNPMYEFICSNTAARWGERFVNDLEKAGKLREEPSLRTQNIRSVQAELVDAYRTAKRPLLLIDYDGTLKSICQTPSEAVPDEELLALLQSFGEEDRVIFGLVSGRDRRDLEEWFWNVPIYLCAEHGYTYREPGDEEWKDSVAVDLSWKSDVKRVLEYFKERTPGALIEDKHSSLTWHFRQADPDYGQWQAEELMIHLEEILARSPAEAVRGRKVIEIRPHGINKGAFAKRMLNTYPEADFILCIGDDQTDVDMYTALPSTAWTCHVGSLRPLAAYYAESPEQVRTLLQALISV